MKKLLSILLSLLILLGNMGLTLSTHFCGGKAVKSELSIGKAHIGCGMEKAVEDCDIPQVDQSSCCNDQSLSLEVEDDFSSSYEYPSFQAVFLQTFVEFYLGLKEKPQVPQRLFTAYSPPPPKQRLQVLFQTFLI